MTQTGFHPMADLDYSLKWPLAPLRPVKGLPGVAVEIGLPQLMRALLRKKMIRKKIPLIIPHAFAKQSQFHLGLAPEYELC